MEVQGVDLGVRAYAQTHHVRAEQPSCLRAGDQRGLLLGPRTHADDVVGEQLELLEALGRQPRHAVLGFVRDLPSDEILREDKRNTGVRRACLRWKAGV